MLEQGSPTYLRSISIQVVTDYNIAQREPVKAQKYGVLEPGDSGILQEIKPLFTLGYAF